MALTAGREATIKVEDTGVSPVEIKATDASLDTSAGEIDVTDFTTNGWNANLSGMKSYSLNFTMIFDNSDSLKNKVRDAYLNSTVMDFEVLPDGTNGFTGSGFVTQYNISTPVDGAASIDVVISSDGTALSTTP